MGSYNELKGRKEVDHLVDLLLKKMLSNPGKDTTVTSALQMEITLQF